MCAVLKLTSWLAAAVLVMACALPTALAKPRAVTEALVARLQSKGGTVHCGAPVAGIETCLTPMPEAIVRDAPAGSAFVILTHDHALDFLIATEALLRQDASYVGMIGSKTKRATFRNWLSREVGKPELFSGLVCPIGGDTVKDKRPAVIATLAAAEILTAALVEPMQHRAEKRVLRLDV